jgi:hypothetical protein
LICESNTLVGQLLETLEVLDMLADILSFVSGDVRVELFAFMKALQVKIRALGDSFIAPFL